MKKINNKYLDNIIGGSTNVLTGPIISAFVNIVRVMIEAGELVGSSIRRISEGEMCPLK